VRAFGINVPRLITLTYGLGVGWPLWRRAGGPHPAGLGADGYQLVLVVFAVVVIGGMGSIMARSSPFRAGLIEGLTKVYYPPASNTVIFVVMALVLLVKPAGLSGRPNDARRQDDHRGLRAVLALVAPWVAYPVFLMTALCFALFACASTCCWLCRPDELRPCMFFGMAGYFFGYVVKTLDMPPELGLLAGVLGAAALGLVTGALAIRRQGIYFAMITLAFAQMIYFFCVQAPFTGGEDGCRASSASRCWAD